MHPHLLEDTHALLNTRPGSVGPNRRLALQSALGLGYVAAAGPVMAQTAIKTSGEGLVEGEVMVDVNGFNLPVYRAAPKGKTQLPVVLVVSEIFGVHEYIADVTRRFAQAGYLAMAPELFVRQGDPSEYGELAKLQSELIAKVPDSQVLGDLDACLRWAQRNGGDVRHAGITGFCWGGRITWLYAAHNPQIKAAVSWYGRVEGQTTPNTPRHPVDVAKDLKVPVLGLYGEADTGISVASVERLKAALAHAGQQGNRAAQQSRLVIYPQAQHAFHADYRPTYQAQAATDGWQRALAWFKQYL